MVATWARFAVLEDWGDEERVDLTILTCERQTFG